MSINDESPVLIENKTPSVSPGTYSPVTVHIQDTMGTIFLGVLTSILLIEWIRSETRYRTLLTQIKSDR